MNTSAAMSISHIQFVPFLDPQLSWMNLIIVTNNNLYSIFQEVPMEKPFLHKFIYLCKLAAGSSFAWKTAEFFGSIHPYLAPLSVILCVQPSLEKSVRFSIQRIIGTIIGVMFTVLFFSHVSPGYLTLALSIFLGMLTALCLGMDVKVMEQTALSVLLVIGLEHESKHYPADRIRDTLIGILVAVFLQLLHFQIRRQKRKKVQKSSE